MLRRAVSSVIEAEFLQNFFSHEDDDDGDEEDAGPGRSCSIGYEDDKDYDTGNAFDGYNEDVYMRNMLLR